MFRERKSNRMHGYDYSRDALYFVTSCVKDRVCCFGDVINGRMVLNEYGAIAQKQWAWLAEQYAYVVLHAFVVMPNHIHGIIEINSNHGRLVGTGRDLSLRGDLSRRNNIKIKSLSELIGAYKTTVSKQIHQLGHTDFAWQRSFHDHIIRNEKSFYDIRENGMKTGSFCRDKKSGLWRGNGESVRGLGNYLDRGPFSFCFVAG